MLMFAAKLKQSVDTIAAHVERQQIHLLVANERTASNDNNYSLKTFF